MLRRRLELKDSFNLLYKYLLFEINKIRDIKKRFNIFVAFLYIIYLFGKILIYVIIIVTFIITILSLYEPSEIKCDSDSESETEINPPQEEIIEKSKGKQKAVYSDEQDNKKDYDSEDEKKIYAGQSGDPGKYSGYHLRGHMVCVATRQHGPFADDVGIEPETSRSVTVFLQQWRNSTV